MKKITKPVTNLYLFPAALAVVFISSILIIVSPVGTKTLIPLPTPTVSTPVAKIVTITSPDLTKPVKSPLTISGKIDRSWVFEASFPVELFDSQNHAIYTGTGLAPKWFEGSDQFVDFSANLKFSTTDAKGYLVIHNDNPSGLPQNDKSVKFPVIFSNAR
jgi:hypothetical protein